MNEITMILFLSMVSIATAMMPGGFQDLNVDDAATEVVAKFAVRELGSKYKLVNIISGMKQVVNGERYKLKLKVDKKSEGKTKKLRCSMVVLMVPHDNYKELEEFHCYFARGTPTL